MMTSRHPEYVLSALAKSVNGALIPLFFTKLVTQFAS